MLLQTSSVYILLQTAECLRMSDELQVSHWFKRLTSDELMFGDSDDHLQRFAALSRSASV